MSLRARLLVAIGVIALVALAVADVVTYSALQSFLYQRIDQQLDQSHVGIEALGERRPSPLLLCHSGPERPGPNPSAADPGPDQNNQPPSNAIEVQAVEVRTLQGRLSSTRRAVPPT